jgi:hypothetical protein
VDTTVEQSQDRRGRIGRGHVPLPALSAVASRARSGLVRAPRSAHRPPSSWASLAKRMFAVGALAGTVSAVVALGTDVFSWFGHEDAKITSLTIGGVTPLTYGEWRTHERVPLDGVPADQLAATGRMVAFDLQMANFSNGDQITVRLILHDVTHSRSEDFETDAVTIDETGDSCGCFEWIPVPRSDTTYYLEIALYPPDPFRPEFRRSWAHDPAESWVDLGKRQQCAGGSCYYRPGPGRPGDDGATVRGSPARRRG